ncbi:MAG: F0F1 ATP synthase subunit gamma [Clostridiales Family XIII bacterium]|nr:F0F1 ATP synthase subunit gamma [Clostridiales Family XIII bacterium]
MKMKTVVKVMNFHSLVHIDAARRMTEKYIRMEAEVTKIIDIIVNNRNFILDKLALKVNEVAPPLNIYIGSDFSFCGGLNSIIRDEMMKDDEGEKIIIGRKLRASTADDVLVAMTKEEFDEEYYRIERILDDSIRHMRHSSINVIYNHYYHSGNISLRNRKIFPIPLASGNDHSTEDFVVEGDVESLLRSLTSTYASYEVKIASINSFASENIMRQAATTESLKKIDEIEETQLREARKVAKQKAFAKVFDNYIKKTVHGGKQH